VLAQQELSQTPQTEFPIDPSLIPIGSKPSKSPKHKRHDRTGARKFKPSTIARALTEARGNISEAARRLHCSRDTIRKAIRENDTCRIARDDAEAIEVDYAASHAADARDAGKPWALKQFLNSAKASRHGYGPAPKAVTEPCKDQSRSWRRGIGCGYDFGCKLGIERNQVPFKSLIGLDTRSRTCCSHRLVAPAKALLGLRLRFSIDSSLMPGLGPIQSQELPGKSIFSDARSDRTGVRVLTHKQVCEALIMSRGNFTITARRLRCKRNTITKAVRENEIFRDVLETVEAMDVDHAVAQCHAARNAGHSWALMHFLNSALAAPYGYRPAGAGTCGGVGPVA